MPEGIIVNGIDTIVLQFGEVMAKAYRGKNMQVGRTCKSRKTLDQGYDAPHSIGRTDLLYSFLYFPLFLRIDQDAPVGFIQQVFDGFCLR